MIDRMKRQQFQQSEALTAIIGFAGMLAGE